MADKVGLDDFIAAGGDVEGLILNSTPAGELATNATSAETRIAELSTLSALDYDRVRKGVADDLGVRASTLDRAVAAKRQKAAEDAKAAAELAAAPQPWADPVDGDALLNEIAGTLRKFVVMSERDAWLAALWVLHSYTIDIAEISPILRIVSPTPSCGKSTLVAILARIVRRGYIVAQISNAAFARLIHLQKPTLLLDEGDAFLNENEVMRNTLDGCFDRDTSRKPMLVPMPNGGWNTVELETFTAIVIASIGRLRKMRTVESRALHIYLKRATKAELKTISKAYRRVIKAAAIPLAAKCLRWATDNASNLDETTVQVPDAVEAREADKHRLMIGIADLAGGDWPKRARDLALEASKPDRRATDEMYSVLILSDLRDLFIKEAMERRFSPTGDRIPSAELCMSLGAMPERPWVSYGRSRALITQMKVAELLEPFEVLPKTIWCTEKRGKEVVNTTPRGYDLKDCSDAFERNLPPLDPPTPPSSTPETPFQGASVPDPFSPNGLESLEQGASGSSTGTLKTEPKSLGEKGSGTLAGQNADFGGARAQAGSNGTESDRLIERAYPDTSVSTGGVIWSEIQRRVAEANAALVPPDTKMFDDYTQEAVVGLRQTAGNDARDDRGDARGDAAQPRALRRSKKPAKKSTKKGGRK